MKKLRKLSHALLSSATLMVLSQTSYGLGLGPIQLQSYLNQPLIAKVKINEIGDVSANEIRVQMASREAFEKAGISRNFSLTNFDFEVVKEGDEHFVYIKSFDPIRDPFLSFIVEARWSSGTVLREFTVLLDPIEVAAQYQPTKPVAKPVKALPKSNAPLKTGQFYGPVAPNDTLWEIASRLAATTGSDVEQTMMAIAAKNPDAFLRGNINGLKQKVTLKLPTQQETKLISRSEAIARIKEHDIAWRQRRDVAPITLSRPVVEAQPAVVAGPKKPVELIVPGQEVSKQAIDASQMSAQSHRTSNPQAAELQQRLLMIEETIDTLKRINANLQKNQDNLQKRNQELLAIVEAKESELLNLRQYRAQTAITEQPQIIRPQQADGQADVIQPEQVAEPVVISPQDPTKTLEQATAGSVNEHDPKTTLSQSLQDQIASYTKNKSGQKTMLEGQAPAQKLAGNFEAPTVATSGTSASQATGAILAAPTTSTPEPQSSNLWVWIALLFGTGAAAAGFEYVRRYRPELLADFKSFKLPFINKPEAFAEEDVVEEHETIQVDTHQEETSPQTSDQEMTDAFAVFDESDESMTGVTSKAQQPSETPSSATSVQTIEALIGQEQFDQALELINQHLETYPQDWEIHVKRLEIFQQLGDFERLTEHLNQLPNDLASNAPNEWQAIQAIIEKGMLAAQAPSQAPQAVESKSPPQQEAINQDEPASQAQSNEIAFDFDSEHHESTNEPEAGQIDSLNLAKQCGVDDNTLEFELASSETAPVQQEADENGHEQNAYLEDKNESETKLALARAYIDLGDSVLANEQLKEVLTTGTPEQKAQAEALLQELKKD